MSYRKLTSIVLAAAASIAACSNHEQGVTFVEAEQYESPECWFNRQGELVAFLVLARRGRLAVPYLESARCMVIGDYGSYGEEVIYHLGGLQLYRSEALQLAFPDLVLSDNSVTHQPVPSSDSKVYLFRARVTRVPHPSRTIYVAETVVEITDTTISFETFLGFSEADRERLTSAWD